MSFLDRIRSKLSSAPRAADAGQQATQARSQPPEAKAAADRFRSPEARSPEAFLRSAEHYVQAMQPLEIEWLHQKPFDHRPGHGQFFLQLYTLLNLLKAMDLPQRSRVLEVGSGPGWVSEILMLLGHRVDGIEPSEAMIAIARERVQAAARHYRIAEPPAVEFHAAAIEDCTLPEAEFEGVLFHDALHHVLDERRGLERCFRALKPGGVLGVSEDAWRPGDRQQEAALEDEMDRFGTLESPFTQEHLDRVLTAAGFVDIERYHSVNGFFPAAMGGLTIERLAQSRADRSNHLTARKPWHQGPTTADPSADTRARVEIERSSFDVRDRCLRLALRLTNTGVSAWLHRPRQAGYVTIALRSDPLGRTDATEARPRHHLPRTVLPGETLTLELDFYLPPGWDSPTWRLDLVNEGFFWFSERGSAAAPVNLGP